MDSYLEYKNRVESIKKILEVEKGAIEKRVLEEVRACVKEFGFSVKDVFAPGGNGKVRRVPKYFDPVTGATWSGNGREPLWMRGKNRKDFELRHESPDGETTKGASG
ncbi:H-NS family nucleoid-associated regulatory protein [Burkholderia ubonensis]|uniref:DNA-binding protein H-NS-like C-terminal domain-containing protein n=1 Tax=Burkholderia ubonensis TaxID=101571 RepID=A0AAW3MMF9_9BURK|nr:H-NS histone family protein [Burkholderia ubonensis]KVK99023.1 hypothetical protein WJ45_15965 [Burkholderia ubonensis]KVN83159.1 hypothetical protein WJ67_04555 [Burkholderia ubonensis]KVO39611.1 hypothetical protein WJ75_08520 [Burkholderia ubonensis]KVP89357.1 hypothetical protein WJ96_20400 [Burkholderia ubonensis]KVQ54219.1 hypothetical protein WK04_02710 [Burkholderia ubonensis]